ncbi:hypothetical protein Y306_01330 [Listeria monocytogenes]|nr:hypothetical protein [Listeria monocytogenes]
MLLQLELYKLIFLALIAFTCFLVLYGFFQFLKVYIVTNHFIESVIIFFTSIKIFFSPMDILNITYNNKKLKREKVLAEVNGNEKILKSFDKLYKSKLTLAIGLLKCGVFSFSFIIDTSIKCAKEARLKEHINKDLKDSMDRMQMVDGQIAEKELKYGSLC